MKLNCLLLARRIVLAGVASSLLMVPGPLRAAPAAPDTADRGPFFSGTIRAKFPGDNTTMKGVVVTLNPERNAFVCYDTDLMRVSVAWTGDYLKFGNYMREIVHPQPPEVAGTPVFGTKPGPGWSRGATGGFADTRPGKQGPLPADWAKYRGLYLNGRQVILSYTVGDAGVLESPGLASAQGLSLFTRTMEVDRSLRGSLLVCEGLPAGATGRATGARASLSVEVPGAQGAPGRLGIGLIGPASAVLELTNGRVTVQLSGREKAGSPMQVVIWSGGAEDEAKFRDVVQSLPAPAGLRALTQGGPPLWKESVVTQGRVGASGADGPYVVDMIGENLTNQWGTRAFFGGFDFFPDGRVALCAFHGDVWIVSGVDDKLENLTWRRFATGIFQGLGCKVVDGKVYVLGRDQITRLHDLNNDGEADFYENFNNDTVVTANYHEFCLDLHTDRKGNFYYFKGSPWTPDVKSPHQGTVLKVSKDGKKLEIYATGLRAPNGGGMGPNDELTVSDNQGHWMPASKVSLVKKGGFYGMTPAAHRDLTFTRGGTNLTYNPSDPAQRAALKAPPFDGSALIPPSYDQPLCWLPMSMDNSSGGQVWATDKRFGPLQGQMLFMSYGKGTLFQVLQEEVDGVTQAGMVRFPLKFGTGLMRGRVNPKDGQVYVCGVRGWQTDGAKDGGFYRVRYTGKPARLATGLKVLKDGIQITFSDPLDPASAADPASYALEAWNYKYTGSYGSPDYSVEDPTQKRHDKWEVKSARLAKDGRTVLLEVPSLKPANQVRIKLNLKAADGAPVAFDIYNTIHKPGRAGVASVK
ncbi:MAG: hypothetical protein RJA22_1281 [Verrucomicrobiota bacterium]|jgi:hypothetical protein